MVMNYGAELEMSIDTPKMTSPSMCSKAYAWCKNFASDILMLELLDMQAPTATK